MTDEQKNTKEQFRNCCENMPFAGMMEAMMSRKEELCGCGCVEMMKKMTTSYPSRGEEDETGEGAKEPQATK